MYTQQLNDEKDLNPQRTKSAVITQITPVPAARLKSYKRQNETICANGLNTSHDESGYNSESMFSTFEKNPQNHMQ